MEWSEQIYLDPKLEKHWKRIKWKIMHNVAQKEVYLLLLPLDGQGKLQMMSSLIFLQKNYPVRYYCIVGLASSKASGYEIITQITSEIYETYGKIDYNQFFQLA